LYSASMNAPAPRRRRSGRAREAGGAGRARARRAREGGGPPPTFTPCFSSRSFVGSYGDTALRGSRTARAFRWSRPPPGGFGFRVWADLHGIVGDGAAPGGGCRVVAVVVLGVLALARVPLDGGPKVLGPRHPPGDAAEVEPRGVDVHPLALQRLAVPRVAERAVLRHGHLLRSRRGPLFAAQLRQLLVPAPAARPVACQRPHPRLTRPPQFLYLAQQTRSVARGLTAQAP
jgi:hypothetical protein